MLSVIITYWWTVHEEDVDAVHAGVLADDRVPRGLDGEDLLSAEEVASVEETAHSAQASAEIVIHLEERIWNFLFVINVWECTEWSSCKEFIYWLMARSSHLSSCTQLRGRREPISNNVFSLINNPVSLLANKTKVLAYWTDCVGVEYYWPIQCVTGWGMKCWETEFASSSQPPLYTSLYSLSVSCHLTTLCYSFYLFTGWSEFPANLQNCVFFIWSSIHCLTWETLANTELSPHVAPTPSPQLITPTSVCWPPCLYVNGPPLSPWQHQCRIRYISFVNQSVSATTYCW